MANENISDITHESGNVLLFLSTFTLVTFADWWRIILKIIATGDLKKLTVTLSKAMDYLFTYLNTVGNIWPNVSTQLNKLYDKGVAST